MRCIGWGEGKGSEWKAMDGNVYVFVCVCGGKVWREKSNIKICQIPIRRIVLAFGLFI